MQNITSKYITINHDSNFQIVHLEWITPPTSSELREGLNKGLELVKSTKSGKWIGDVRNMGAISPDDQEWINTKWFPSAISAGITRMGVIVGDDIFNQMSVEDIMSKVEGTNFVSQFFPSYNEAFNWLSKN